MKKFLRWFCTILCLMFLLTSCSYINVDSQINKSNDQLKISVIDVDQSDSIFIQNNGMNMLIDTGTKDQKQTIENYLDTNNVKKIDYLILTHYHADHIGSAPAIINKYDIGKVYMPKIAHTTKEFENLLDVLSRKNIKPYAPTPGDKFSLGNAECTVLAPNGTDYKEMNDYSIVIRIDYYKKSFLFMGDAQKVSEDQILNKKFNVKADFIKVGHHGSSTSTSEEFIKKVSPEYAVISVGKNNVYGLPSRKIIKRLTDLNIKIYRTDKNGTVVCTSDGKNITISTER